jgi:4,5-dihydroxyphthalate decarboxylase
MTRDTPVTVPLSVMRYDITFPLFEGRVPVDGFAFEPVRTMPMVFSDVPDLREGNFGIWDLNMGYWLAAIDAGWDLVALPIFPKRKAVLQLIFCHAGAGIRRPADLQGKRIGTRQFGTAVTVWAGGILDEHYGVEFGSLRWVAQLRGVYPIHQATTRIEFIDDKLSLVDMLHSGEIDALITDVSDGQLLHRLEHNASVIRLFPDYQAEDLSLYRRAGFYTPVHVMVISGKLDRERPELAMRTYRAFQTAKDLAAQDVASERSGFPILYLRERFNEQQALWGDPSPYGIRANRSMIDAFVRYNHRQGLIRSPLTDERIFAGSTLET